MLIVRGLADFDPKGENSPKDQEVKTSKEQSEEKPESRMGIESAMDKFIKAVHDNDTKKAIDAMMEFQEMCSGYEYYKRDSTPSADDTEEKD